MAKDKDRLAALRDIKAKILLEATSGSGTEVSDEVAIKICQKLFKQRMETYELYVAQNRSDLANEELLQAKVIEEFLPQQLTEDEIKKVIADAIASLGVSGPQDMGKLMGYLTSKLAGKEIGRAHV